MLVARRDRLLAVWEAGFLRDEEVVEWAQRSLLAGDDPPRIPSWLIDLVERGPSGCRELPGFGWPPPLDYGSAFCLRATALDLTDDDAVIDFAEWASRSCIALDLDEPMVAFGYRIDHLLVDCQRRDLAIARVRADLPTMLEACRVRAARLLDLSA